MCKTRASPQLISEMLHFLYRRVDEEVRLHVGAARVGIRPLSFQQRLDALRHPRHIADEDGSCVVLLDGRGSYDPHNQIAAWSWYDERGQELTTAPQVKLKLPVGSHRFELRVVDGEGSWTMDSLLVHILNGSTS